MKECNHCSSAMSYRAKLAEGKRMEKAPTADAGIRSYLMPSLVAKLSSDGSELEIRLPTDLLPKLERHDVKLNLPTLTPRQNQVLRLILDAKVNKEIANDLHISVRTAKFHVSNLLAKFGVDSRMQIERLYRDRVQELLRSLHDMADWIEGRRAEP